jgi:predicted ATPase/class 3 adenylate cyclase
VRDHPALRIRQLPTGTVTLLFTDIEESTRLLEQLGEGYAEALAKHRSLLRATFARHGGVEVDTQGDSFLCAFQRATDAVEAAADAQRALQRTSVKVRMGIHTGEPTRTEEGYVGVDLHRGARLMSASHGGQVLLSQTTRDLCSEIPSRDLGQHRLKDLSEPQRLYQLLGEALESDFPPPRTLENRPTNLPTQPTPLVGRERELADLLELLGRADVRLLTLTGPGGTGKTRLALQAAAELIERYPNGVFFVNLAALTDPELVVPTIAQTLGVKEQPGEPLERTLAERLQEQELLLVLDNFEQVVEAADAVAQVLAAAPQLNLLVTSRASLHLSGEREYDVPPLADSEAIALFAERAQAAKATFNLNGNRPLVAEICRRLDRLPLAIELAAARIKLLPEQALLERLDQKLKLLTGGARDLDERQRTLRAAIDWSYELLSDEEQTLFRRLAVFAGGRSFEAIEAICNSDGDLDVLEGIASLVDKSLLRQEETDDGEPRFVMLETIHEYAWEKLQSSREAQLLRDRHADFFAHAVSMTDQREALGPEGASFLRRLDDDRENIRVTLERLLAADRVEAAAGMIGGMTGGLWIYWMMRGSLEEGLRWTEEALAKVADISPEARFELISIRGEFLRFQGRLDDARPVKEEALALARELDQDNLVAATLHDLGEIALGERQVERARELHGEALLLRRQIGARIGIAHALSGLADVALVEGDLETARAMYEEILETGRESKELDFETGALLSLADVARRAGDLVTAAELAREGLESASRLDSALRIAQGFDAMAVIAAAAGARERAAWLLGAADRVREESGIGLFVEPEAERILLEIRSQLETESLGAAYSEGKETPTPEVIQAALR